MRNVDHRPPLAPLTFPALLCLCALPWLSCQPDGRLDRDKDNDTYIADVECDDSNPDIYPGAEEIPYNGIDEDCDGTDLNDLDGDGVVAQEEGGEDCNDQSPKVYPGAEEICDGRSNRCDAFVDDADRDGHKPLSCDGDDCDDQQADIHPGAEELPYDGIDQDCSGEDFLDVDGDHEAWVGRGGTDCDDQDPSVNRFTELFVPEGVFTMGFTLEGDPNSKTDVHEVTLSAYCMDSMEVSNAQYRACVDASVCPAPTAISSATHSDYFTNPVYDAYPAVNVTYEGAVAYCTFVDKALPTEAQWEKAARGGHCLDGDLTCSVPNSLPERLYPWGDEAPTCSRANSTQAPGCFFDTTPVSALGEGRSPYGILNLGGNASEWVTDWYDPEGYATDPQVNPTGPETGTSHVTRGGGYAAETGTPNTYTRRAGPVTPPSAQGFRCVRTSSLQ